MCDHPILVCCALIVSALGLAGCQESNRHITVCDGRGDADLIRTSYNAIDCMVEDEEDEEAVFLDPCERVVVTSLVNLNDVEDTTTFGRLIAEFLAARLAQHGFEVVHVPVRRGSIVIDNDERLLLSNEAKELAEDADAGAVLLGTYTLGVDKIYTSLKLVGVSDSQVLAAVDYAIPRGPKTMVLLRRGQVAAHVNASIHDAQWDPTLR